MPAVLKSTLGPDPQIPGGNAVAAFLASPLLTDAAAQHRTLYVDTASGAGYTVAQFRRLVPRAAALLQREFGVQKNDVVGLFGTNHIFTPVVHFATLTLGAALSPANVMYSAEELSHQLRVTQPRLLVVLDAAAPIAAAARELAGCAAHVVTFSELFAKFAVLMSAAGAAAAEERPVDVDAKTHTAYLCFSSGTSGLPKAVVTTHYNIIGNTLQQVAARTPVCDPHVPQSGLLPMSHIYGLNVSILVGVYTAKTTAVFARFDLEFFVQKTIEYKLEILFLVPPIILLLGKTDILDRYAAFGEQVRFIMSAAAPLSKDTIELVTRKAPRVLITQGYGLTETTPMVTTGFHADAAQQAAYNQESIGWLLPGAEARLVDQATGQDRTGQHERGELWVRGPMVMAGYFRNPQANAEAFSGEWFRTGDVALIDERGLLHIVDRMKELIKSNGHQVAPAELESILLMHADVLDTAVIGVMNADKTSELPRAFLVLRDGSDVRDVLRWFNQRVAKHKKLWGGAVVLDAIPKSASGKILRNNLRRRTGDVAVGAELAAAPKL